MAKEPVKSLDIFEKLKDEAPALIEARKAILADLDAQRAIVLGDIEKLQAIIGKPKRAAAPSGERAQRGAIQNEIINLLKEHTDGLTRSHFISRMGANGDKTKSASISNALASLKKSGKIGHNSDGYYQLPG